MISLRFLAAAFALHAAPALFGQSSPEKIVGMYVHQHWPYNHPYAARTWTLGDWQGYLGGIHALGFNTVLIWPMLDTMPKPLTASDEANLAKIGRVIDFAHERLRMKVLIVLTPNVAANHTVAGQVPFERRHYFHSDLRVNPADRAAVADMMEWKGKLMAPLARADGVAVIDSDPGGYPGSNNAEFIDLLLEHRKMLDRLRPGIELIYWVHAGWPGYSRYYETATYKRSTDAEFDEALTLLKKHNPEPWGLATTVEIARRAGLESRVVSFRYGQIESEPSFPFTGFNPERARAAGGQPGPRGVVGNAQTHVVQLPNTFAFARGAQGLPVRDEDFRAFGDQLIPGVGETLLTGWKAMASKDPAAIDAAAARVAALEKSPLRGGPLAGLLFGDPQRYIADLVLQLRLNAAHHRLLAASAAKADLWAPLARFHAAAAAWQSRMGYQNQWKWPELRALLATVNSPEIDAVLSAPYTAVAPFGKVMERYHRFETETTRLLTAIEATLKRHGSNIVSEK